MERLKRMASALASGAAAMFCPGAYPWRRAGVDTDRPVRRSIVLVCDPADYETIRRAVAIRERLPPAREQRSSHDGAVLADICREWWLGLERDLPSDSACTALYTLESEE